MRYPVMAKNGFNIFGLKSEISQSVSRDLQTHKKLTFNSKDFFFKAYTYFLVAMTTKNGINISDI